ncbi:hypothetical protein PQX77_014185 [Marasmius sp. AFHP31]|nr:hypothetical protein PQX77_014185 [Marasmius sp. AFHP31]
MLRNSQSASPKKRRNHTDDVDSPTRRSRESTIDTRPRPAPSRMAFPPSRAPSKERRSVTGVRARSPTSSSSKSPTKDRIVTTEVNESDVPVGLGGLSLRSPIASPAVRRSGRKKIPTERLRMALQDSMEQSPPDMKESPLLDRLDFHERVANLNGNACASGAESDDSNWTPKSSPTRVSRGRPRPRALPRSKWFNTPGPSGSHKQIEDLSDGGDVFPRAPSLPRSISPGIYLPTTAEMIHDLQRKKDPSEHEDDCIGSDADDGDNDGSGGYDSWHGIDGEEDVNSTDDVDFEADDHIAGGNDREVDHKDNPYWEQELRAIERDCQYDEYDVTDPFINDGDVTEEDISIHSLEGDDNGQGASDLDSMMEELSVPFNVGRYTNDTSIPSNRAMSNQTPEDHTDQVFYEDLPPINPQRNGSFRSRTKRRVPPSPPSDQQQLSFPRVTGPVSRAGPSGTRRRPLAAEDFPLRDNGPPHVPSSAKTRVQAPDSTVTCSDMRSSPSPTKKRCLRQSEPSKKVAKDPSVSPAAEDVSLPTSNHNVPTVMASSTFANCVPTHTAVATVSNTNSSFAPPLNTSAAGPAPATAPAPAPAPAIDSTPSQGREPALNLSLQHPSLQPIRATMLNHGREIAPDPRPYDIDYALSLLSGPEAQARFLAALDFDSWGRVMNVNRNGNLPVNSTREGMFVSIAGRRVPAVWVTTGFSWTSDLQGVGDGKYPAPKKILVRQVSQEYELFQGSIGALCKQVYFHTQCDQKNGAAAFCTKKSPASPDNASTTNDARPGRYVESGAGTGKALAPMMSGNYAASSQAVPDIYTKLNLRYDDEVPIFDGRESLYHRDIGGFQCLPRDWETLESLPRFPVDGELPENTLVTVGFSMLAYPPFNKTMVNWGVNLNLMFIIVLDITARSILSSFNEYLVEQLPDNELTIDFMQTLTSKTGSAKAVVARIALSLLYLDVVPLFSSNSPPSSPPNFVPRTRILGKQTLNIPQFKVLEDWPALFDKAASALKEHDDRAAWSSPNGSSADCPSSDSQSSMSKCFNHLRNIRARDSTVQVDTIALNLEVCAFNLRWMSMVTRFVTTAV